MNVEKQKGKLKALLREKGLSYKDLAKILDLSEGTVRNGLNAKKLPSWALSILYFGECH